MSGWQHAELAALVGERVVLRPHDGRREDRLEATVTACTDPETHGDTVSYQVLVVADAGPAPRQDLYLLEAPGREPEPIFLVPVGQAEGRTTYEAVFNQTVDQRSGS